jgi:hypothetical protein
MGDFFAKINSCMGIWLVLVVIGEIPHDARAASCNNP